MAGITCRHNHGFTCCWCVVCHQERLQRHRNLSLDMLFRRFEFHPERESEILETLFGEVLDSAAFGKLIKDEIQRTTMYTYVLPYLKNTAPFNQMEKTDREKLAAKINNAAWVFDNIATIQSNLVQVRSDVTIDIRRLSLHSLWKAKELVWCHDYANKIAERSKKPNELAYTEDQYQDLLALIRQNPCFQEVSNNPTQATSLMARLQRDLVRRTLPRD